MTRRIAGHHQHQPDDPQPEPGLPDADTEQVDYQAALVSLAKAQLASQDHLYRRIHFILNVFYTLLGATITALLATFLIILYRN